MTADHVLRCQPCTVMDTIKCPVVYPEKRYKNLDGIISDLMPSGLSILFQNGTKSGSFAKHNREMILVPERSTGYIHPST